MLSETTFLFDASKAGAPAAPTAAASMVPNRIFGRNWSEDIEGTAGVDWIYGGKGDDFLLGFEAGDRLYGGEGDDWLWGGDGNDRLYGDLGNDMLRGEGGNDLLYGGNGSNTLVGGEGNDKLYGSWNDERLFGSEGDDSLFGHTGNDRIAGGDGKDVISTGEGYDNVVFDAYIDGVTNIDRLTDFNPWADRISLKASMFETINRRGPLKEDAFVIAARAQDASDRIVYDKAGGYLYFDPDGKGGLPQFVFAKIGTMELSHAAFVVI